MRKHILIADTSKVSRYVLENYLSEKFNVASVSSISEALDISNEIKPDLVIMSYELKDGNAFQFCESLKEKNLNIPLVIITSNKEEISKYDAYEYGIIEFLDRDKIDESIVDIVDEIINLYSNINLSDSYIVAVDDSITQLKFIENVLQQTNAKYKLFSDPKKFLMEIEKQIPDICIIDIFMDEIDGIELTKAIRKNKKLVNTRIVIQTGSRESSLIRTLIVFGADDYLLKPYSPEELLLKIINNVKIKKINDELDEINKELFLKATTDPLTKLYNRRFILEQLNILIANFNRYLTPFAVIILDLDHFKHINDTYGHDVGDDVLVHFSSILRATLRKTDIIGRFGGEEFLCLIPNISNESIATVVSKILSNVRSYKIKSNNETITFTVSIGCCIFNKNYKTSNEIIKCADEMLYMAKNNGRNRAYLKIDDDIIEIT
ncbi:diguanylate cyclase [Deferribacter autotrophicus]|uniref:diguanylate cyclase n=1 Tax=Deferribacter autotrophicus TaxID=500465 RepID=A0A5A8F5T6_9BACT|nr:diguanylate cyclase [Deferribacter autotrophicus]KAA0259484.1 diguanylate cyclase [Deferribacter autotrophicus]